MRLDKYSNPIFNEQDLFDAIYNGHEFNPNDTLIVDSRSTTIQSLEDQIGFKFVEPYETHFETNDYDSACQSNWNMPDEYKQLDIAAHILGLCASEAELQRCGEELLLFQERNLFDLLRYLKYLVDIMTANNVIWGVGRGSSVASYVLYRLGVHRIDSLFYNLDCREFLR